MKFILLFALFLSVKSTASVALDVKTSGKPLPRFASLRYSNVNARVGPGTQYPIKYVYKTAPQPIKILNEYYAWYQVEDIKGDKAWVHKHYIGKPNFATARFDTKLYKSQRSSSDVRANITEGIVFKVDKCNGYFCKAETSFSGRTFKGYIPKTSLWGVE